MSQDLSTALRERGMRVTPQRIVVHRALRDLDRHVTADELLDAVCDRLPNVSLPTIYATLELLEQLQRRVDRRQRDVRQPVADGIEQLVGRDMAIEVAQRTVHDDPLRGDPHPTLAQGGAQVLTHW